MQKKLTMRMFMVLLVSSVLAACGADNDSVPPELVSTTPADGAVDVARDAALGATFNEDLRPSSLDASTFTLADDQGNPVEGTITLDDATDTVGFTPTGLLEPGTTYTATLTTGIEDEARNPLAANITFQFTTVDDVAPSVTGTTPDDQAVEVELGAVVSAVFDEALLAGSVNDTTFTLADSQSNAVAGTVSLDAANNTATFTPNAELAPGTTYTATLTTGITDLAGNALADAVTVEFTTLVDDLTIESRAPADGATDIALDATVSATFNLELQAGSVSDTTFTLVDDQSNPIAGTVSLDAGTNTVTFTPAADLVASTTYTVTATTGILPADTNANPFPADETWQFTTRDRVWGTTNPAVSASPTDSVVDFALAGDDSGNALAVWEESGSILASYYDVSTDQWSSPVLLETSDDAAALPQVAMSANGNGLAVWEQNDPGGTNSHIWSNHFDGSTGQWGTAVLIESIAGALEGFDAKVAMDSNGNGIAAWEQEQDGTADEAVWVNHFDASTGLWGTEQRIESETSDADEITIVMDAAGNAMAVWEQDNGTGSDNDILANRYDAATSLWGTPVALEAGADNALDPKLALNAASALAVWEQGGSVWANRYDVSSGLWGTAVEVYVAPDGDPDNPLVEMDNNGNGLMVVREDAASGTDSLMASRYDAGTGQWGTAVLLDSTTLDTDGFSMAINSSTGDAWAVWVEVDANAVDSIFGARFNAATGNWEAAVLVENNGDADANSSPLVTIDASGNATAIWPQQDVNLIYQIFSNRYQ